METDMVRFQTTAALARERELLVCDTEGAATERELQLLMEIDNELGRRRGEYVR